jgi:hypothetical protein
VKKLLTLPLAAALCGTLCHPPRLKPELSVTAGNSCQERAKNYYLMAYAYQGNEEERSRNLARKAIEQLSHCPHPELKERIAEFKKSSP